MSKNPSWTWEELVLALDLYFRHNPRHVSPEHPEVIALSQLLRLCPVPPHEVPDKNTFRSPAAVYKKLCNFLRFDPSYPGVGLSHGSKLEEKVWKEFCDDIPSLKKAAAAIRERLLSGHKQN